MEKKNNASVKCPIENSKREQIRHDGYFTYQPAPEKPKSSNTVKAKFKPKTR